MQVTRKLPPSARQTRKEVNRVVHPVDGIFANFMRLDLHKTARFMCSFDEMLISLLVT